MENEKKVIAIVVTYNRKELLKECVNALLNQDYKNCDVLIVDNASTDGTKEYLEDELKEQRVHYVNTGANLGGAGGFNYGMKEAYKIGCDFMWIMDDDCIVHNDSLTELMNANEELKEEYGFLSSKVLWKDDSICKMNIQKQKFSRWLKDFDKNMQPIAMASFVSLFIKTSIVEEMGLPIKDFFIWTDDWEYTRRISRKYKCYYVAKSIVTHKSKLNEGASIATVDGDRLDRFKNMYRNDVVLYRREGIKGWILLYIRLLLHKFRILKSKKEDKKKRIKIIDNAIKEGKNFYPQIEYVHKNVNEKVKVLQAFGEPLSSGGQESFVMNMYRKIDKEKVQFEFFTPFKCDNEDLKTEIELLGGKVFTGNSSFDIKTRKTNFKKELAKFLKTHKYNIVHINSGSTYELAYGAKIAKKNDIDKVIVHSHCVSKTEKLKDKIKNKILKSLTKNLFLKNADIYLACSNNAAETKFPNKIIKSNVYKVIKNGIDLEKFKFNEETRKIYRNKFDFNNKKVICHIGRFAEQKNQKFVIEVFKRIHDIDDSSRLVMIGEGEDEDKIRKFIKQSDLEKSVQLLGVRNDVNKILQGADLFLFPSLYEGLGIVAIEAQATGLNTICSTNVPMDAKVTELCYYLDLKNPEEWARLAINLINKKEERKDTSKEIRNKGYDSELSAKQLLDIYIE